MERGELGVLDNVQFFEGRVSVRASRAIGRRNAGLLPWRSTFKVGSQCELFSCIRFAEEQSKSCPSCAFPPLVLRYYSGSNIMASLLSLLLSQNVFLVLIMSLAAEDNCGLSKAKRSSPRRPSSKARKLAESLSG
jgi:hypothetical protein